MPHFLHDIKVIDPESPFHDQTVHIRIENGVNRSSDLEVTKKSDDHELSFPGGHISPSWVDIGTQSGEPGFEHRETFESLARAAHAGGYGHLIIRPNTAPPLDQAAAIRNVKSLETREQVQFHPMALASVQAEGEELTEWLDLAQAGAAAFTDGPHALRSNAFMLKALKYSQRSKKPLIHFPHDATFVPGAMVHESRQSVEMGLRGWPSSAETLLLDRDLNLLEYISAPLVWHNLSSAQAVRRLEEAAKRLGRKVPAGVGYLHLCYTEEEVKDFNTLFKLSPPLRAEEDRQALWKAVEKGLIHYVASDHFPLEEDQKKTSFPHAEAGAEGLESSMAAFITFCPLKDPLRYWVQLASHGPRQLLQWDPVIVQKGQMADFTLFDPAVERILEKKHLRSRSKNNPNLGRSLKGKVYGRFYEQSWIPFSEK